MPAALLTLREPLDRDKQAIEDMVAEFEQAQSPHDGGFWTDGAFDFTQWLAESKATRTHPQPGFVPAVQYVSFDESGKAMGFLSLRLELNEYLLNFGGHIGYSIRPGERRKGYAIEQLIQGIKHAHDLGLDRLLLTCHKTNGGSRRTIMKCGGVLEDVRGSIERYWIG